MFSHANDIGVDGATAALEVFLSGLPQVTIRMVRTHALYYSDYRTILWLSIYTE